MVERPNINDCRDGTKFREWYYLKEELIAFARENGLQTTGGKFEIADRIAYFLDNGTSPERKKPRKVSSKFNWHSDVLTDETIITDSYKNSQNIRRYFESKIDGFSFSIPLMDWMKANTGKSLADAVKAAKRIKAEKSKGIKQPNQPHNQYNAYTRAYFEAVSDGTQDEVRALWAVRRTLPGPYVFDINDLALVRL